MEKVFKIVSVNDQEDDYWLSKTEADRLQAVMILREIFHSLNKELTKHGKKLVRVYNIVNRQRNDNPNQLDQNK
jgi:hypothetical protein